jgi:hypothetical protein
MNSLSKLADQALANYDFGDGVTVEGTGGWVQNGDENQLTCSVFLTFDDSGEPSTLSTFTVDIEDGIVTYAGCSCHGELVGSMVLAD